jgi:DNA-binding NarL/FixJ family response regulator
MRGSDRAGVVMRTRTQLGVFLAAYLVYVTGRWVAAGDIGPATEHARWIVDLERDLGVEVERSVQQALDSGPVMWLPGYVYLAAQLAVLPGSLIYLYRRAPAVYRRLRDTVLATWLIAVPIYAAFPVAPPRLAGLGMSDVVSEQGGGAHRALDALLQRARRRPEPPLRLRGGDRDRARRRRPPARDQGRLPGVGAARVPRGRRDGEPLRRRHRRRAARQRRRLPGGPARRAQIERTPRRARFVLLPGPPAVLLSLPPTRTRLIPMIRIAVLDRHPAVRAGLDATIREYPGLACAGAAADRRELWVLVYRARPDIVLVEHDPGVSDGLGVCRRLKAQRLGPRVVLCIAGADTSHVVPATLAGADAIVDKAADLRVLVHTIRVVGAGGRVMPAITPALQARAAARLAPQDRAIFAMCLAGTDDADIASIAGLDRRALAARVEAIVATLGARTAAEHPHRGGAPELGLRCVAEAA